MIRAIIDEAVPADAASRLTEGALIASAASLGYDWLITCDKRMPYQQNLADRTISVLVLPTPNILELTRIRDEIRAALGTPVPGHFVILDIGGAPVGDPVPVMIGARGRRS